MKNKKPYFAKRFLDIAIALVSIIILSPVFFIVAILVRINLGSPILFKQKRGGYKGTPFTLIKFRSMVEKYDENNNLLPDEKRLTNFGRFLRSTSLDEIPSYYNVLKGELSIVGPRPLIFKYVKLYSKEQARRLDVKPGFTGWAQINGRNALKWEDKFKLDVFYVDNQSFLFDLKIMFITFFKILKREGISPAGKDTVEEFRGSK